jgi:hypothetical protein
VPSRTILADPDQALDASGSSGPAWSAAVGIDYDGVVQVLEAEGVEKVRRQRPEPRRFSTPGERQRERVIES